MKSKILTENKYKKLQAVISEALTTIEREESVDFLSLVRFQDHEEQVPALSWTWFAAAIMSASWERPNSYY